MEKREKYVKKKNTATKRKKKRKKKELFKNNKNFQNEVTVYGEKKKEKQLDDSVVNTH